ncbi:hypothetical protein KR032_010570, partial [Drosophila birchii]
ARFRENGKRKRASRDRESPEEPNQPEQLGTLHQHQGRIRAAITMEGRRFMATLDTGATHSFISEDLAKELHKKLNTRDIRTQVKLADGTCRELTRALAAIIHCGDRSTPTILLVMTDVLDDVLLGMDFLCNGYWQIPVARDSRECTAFTVPGRGLFLWRVMPFGLHSAPAAFQRALDTAIGPDMEPLAFAYLDDIIRHIAYLGHVISEEGIHTDSDKVAAIRELQPLTCLKELRRCLGIASWYRRFVPNFADFVEPMTSLLKKGKKWNWTPRQDHAFQVLKTRLTEAPVLVCPDFGQEFVLQTDASEYGIGAVLTQTIDGQERVVAYASRRSKSAERNYSVTEKECLAIEWAVRKMRCYIEGYRFEVITDYQALKWLNSIDNPTGRIARWALELQQYQYDVHYRRGAQNLVADGLSRQPLPVAQQAQVQGTNCKWLKRMLKRVRTEPAKFPDFREESGQLYRRIGLRPQEEEYTPWKLCVRADYRHRVLQENHDIPAAGHLGVRKSSNRVAQRYYWPGLFRDVARYIRNCLSCQRYKVSQEKPAGHMFTRQVEEQFHILCADFVGPLPRSK